MTNKPTICFNCSRFDCSWLLRMHPIPGWKAQAITINNEPGQNLQSYKVRSCPLYRAARKRVLLREVKEEL
jgi:hypothetical protein